MPAPYATDIAALRPREARARRAHNALALLIGLSEADELGQARLAEVRAAWGAPDAGLDALRSLLAPVAAELPQLAHALTSLRAAQHEALHAPEWAAFVADLEPVIAERDALVPVAARATARVHHLRAARDAADAMSARLAALPEQNRAAVAAAWSEAFGELLGSLGLSAPAGDPASAARSLDLLLPAAEAEAADAASRLAALDALLQSHLG